MSAGQSGAGRHRWGTVARMYAARFIAVALAIAVLAGCSATPEPVAPEPTTAPQPSASPSAAWPSPSHLIPGTPLKAGPTPGTVIGPTGAHLRYVPPVAGWVPECRPASADELAAMRRQAQAVGNTPNTKRGPAVAVDLPEPGWSVVAYWNTWPNGEEHDAALVRGANGHASGVGWAWAGTHTYGGAAFADGPEALRAARECMGATP